MILSEQLRAARSLLDWDQKEIATRAGVGIATVKRLEARSGVVGGTMDMGVRLKSALEAAGIKFVGVSGVKLWKK